MSSKEQVRNTINTTKVPGTQLSTEHRWLNPSQLEEEYGFSKSTQSKMRMTSNGSTIPFSKIGKFILYDRHEINAWITNHQIGGL